jgi:hypothetical protein
MASAIHSVEVAKETLFEQGFLDWKDLAVGDGIQEMEKKGFEFHSEIGLDFCQKYVLSTVSMTKQSWYLSNAFSASYLSWNPSSATRPAFSHIA